MDTVRPRKYEFAVLVVIIAVLALLLMGALQRAGGEFEEASVQSEVAAMRIELLDWVAHRETYGGKLPESRNPVVWIGRQPEGYVGELDEAPSQPAVWYYDKKQQLLVYRFRSGREARFRLVVGAEAAGVPAALAGVALRRMDVVGQ